MRLSKEAGADLVEIRVDLLSENERAQWKTLVESKLLPAIVTNRAPWEGGFATSDEQSRLAVLSSAILLGAEYVDVELAAVHDFKTHLQSQNISLSSKLIVSHHNFEGPLSLQEIRQVYDKMVSSGADICKIAMTATSARESGVVFQAFRDLTAKPLILLAMGELGQCTRILARKFGSFLTFCSVNDDNGSAPGQIATDKLVNLYRFRSVSPSTKVYGVIGDPISHSMSPAVFNACFKKAGLDAIYVPLRVTDEVAMFIKSMIPFDFAGFSVTIPGKVAALEAMDFVEMTTSKIGAMNTVVVKPDGALWGFNTDWVAAISAIEEALALEKRSLRGARVLCLGAGGAARGLVFGALERGARHVVIANRTLSKAQRLADEVGACASAVSYEALLTCLDSDRPERSDAVSSSLADKTADDAMKSGFDPNSFDVVMNTTSIGMHPRSNETPLQVEALVRFGRPLVFDAVYNPLETRLLSEAREVGCTCVSGLEMFVRQAAEQFKLWFPELQPDIPLMRDVVLARLGRN